MMEELEGLLHELDMVCNAEGEMRAAWRFFRMYPVADDDEIVKEINARMQRAKEIKMEILGIVESGDWEGSLSC